MVGFLSTAAAVCAPASRSIRRDAAALLVDGDQGVTPDGPQRRGETGQLNRFGYVVPEQGVPRQALVDQS